VDFRITSVRPYRRDDKEKLPEGNSIFPPLQPAVEAILRAPAIPKAPVVEIPVPRINRDDYAVFPETYVGNTTFLTEKEKRDRHLAIELRGQGVITAPGLPFQESRRKEISSLLGKGVFKLIQLNDVPKGAKIFNSRLVDEVKGKETTSPYEKSRLVIQAFNDSGKTSILTQSPTI
jgi:hypothetical protein